MNKYTAITFFIFLMSFSLNAQSNVKWLTFEEAIEKSKTEPRKIVIDLYTDWCGWCKKMDANTFQTDYISAYLNENYYPVKFNAEQKEMIEFKGKEYSFVKSQRRGYHELAAAVTNGKLSYPTVVFLDEDHNVLQAIPGYQDAKTFEMIISYFFEDRYKDTLWNKYVQSYVSPNASGVLSAPKKVQPASLRGK